MLWPSYEAPPNPRINQGVVPLAVAARHASRGDRPVAEDKGGARVGHRRLEPKARLVATVAEAKRAADAGAVDGLPAKVVGVEFGRPE